MKDLGFLLGWFPNWLRPAWITNSFPVIRIIIMIALLVFAVVMVISILFQPTTSAGMGAIAGQSTETFYSKNKGKSLQGIFRKLTIISAVCVLVLAVLYLVSIQIYSKDMESAKMLTQILGLLK